MPEEFFFILILFNLLSKRSPAVLTMAPNKPYKKNIVNLLYSNQWAYIILEIPERNTPEINPDQVLFGLICGHSFGPLSNFPKNTLIYR